jgi:hypothetical protein
MFDSLTDETLRAAHDAARLLYDNHRALGRLAGSCRRRRYRVRGAPGG